MKSSSYPWHPLKVSTPVQLCFPDVIHTCPDLHALQQWAKIYGWVCSHTLFSDLFLIPAIKTDSLAILLWLQVLTKITHFNKEQFSILVLYLSLSACFYLLFLLNKLFIWKIFQEQLILITWKQFDWLIKRCFPFRNTSTNLRLILLSKVRMFELEGRICTSLDSRNNVVTRCWWEWSCAEQKGRSIAQWMRKPYHICLQGFKSLISTVKIYMYIYSVTPSRENLKSILLTKGTVLI